MKSLHLILVFFTVSLAACGAHTKVTQLDPDGICPAGEVCVSFTSSGMDAEGGGVQKGQYLVQKDESNKVSEVKPVHASIGADRLDTIGATVLGVGGYIAGQKIRADGIEDAADKAGKWSVEAAKNTQPTQISVSSSATGGSATGGSATGGSASANPTVTATVSQENQSAVAVGVTTSTTGIGTFNPTP